MYLNSGSNEKNTSACMHGRSWLIDLYIYISYHVTVEKYTNIYIYIILVFVCDENQSMVGPLARHPSSAWPHQLLQVLMPEPLTSASQLHLKLPGQPEQGRIWYVVTIRYQA